METLSTFDSLRLPLAVVVGLVAVYILLWLGEIIYVICNRDLFYEYIRTRFFPRDRLFWNNEKQEFYTRES